MTFTLGASIFQSMEIGIENNPYLPLVDGCLLSTFIHIPKSGTVSSLDQGQ